MGTQHHATPWLTFHSVSRFSAMQHNRCGLHRNKIKVTSWAHNIMLHHSLHFIQFQGSVVYFTRTTTMDSNTRKTLMQAKINGAFTHLWICPIIASAPFIGCALFLLAIKFFFMLLFASRILGTTSPTKVESTTNSPIKLRYLSYSDWNMKSLQQLGTYIFNWREISEIEQKKKHTWFHMNSTPCWLWGHLKIFFL